MMKNLLLVFLCFGVLSSVSGQEIYFEQTWEDGQPSDYLVTGDGWIFGTGAEVSSTYFNVPDNGGNVACFNDDGLGNGAEGGGRIETSEIDLSAATGPVFLELSAFFLDLDYGGADETATIYVSNDNGASWSIAIEFGSTGGWGTVYTDLSDYAGQKVKLAFEYIDGNAWNYGWAVDNITLANELINRRNFAISAGPATLINSAVVGTEYFIEGFVANNGLEDITSFDLTAQGTGVDFTESIDGVTIEPGGIYRATMSTGIMVAEGNNTITFSISNVNGDDTDDSNAADNVSQFQLNGLSVGTDINEYKSVVVEEATGTWCTWCPRGAAFMDEMAKRYGSYFSGIAVHNGDPMANSEYDGWLTSFDGFLGFPSVVYQRNRILDPSDIVGPSVVDLNSAPPAAITVGAEFDESTRSLTGSIELAFLEDVAADHRVLLVLTESGVTGTSDAYNQINAYAGGGQGNMGGYEILPNPIPADFMVYNHVGRALIGGAEGVANIVVGEFLTGDRKGYHFNSYTVPGEYNVDNMHIIGMLVNSAGEVTNAANVSFEEALANGLSTGTKDIYDNTFAEVYPNPVQDVTTVYMSLDEPMNVNTILVNSVGQRIMSFNHGTQAGETQINYDLTKVTPGVYYLHIQADDKLITKKITKVQ